MHFILNQVSPIFRDVLFSFLNSVYFPRILRSRAWSLVGLNVQKSALINPGAFIGRTKNLTIGADTFINYGCFFDLAAPTIIGRRCDIGYEVAFITSSHEIGTDLRRAGIGASLPIQVGDGVWIGARAMILPGVVIGDGCIVAAGAVVAADCSADGLYAGIPAKRIRDLD